VGAHLITHEKKPFTHLLLDANPQHNLLHSNGILSPAIIIFSHFLIFHHDRLKQFWFLSITHHSHTNLSDLNDLYIHSIIGHHLLKVISNEIGISYSYKLPVMSDENDGRKCKMLNTYIKTTPVHLIPGTQPTY